jgi:hypothetical protein
VEVEIGRRRYAGRKRQAVTSRGSQRKTQGDTYWQVTSSSSPIPLRLLGDMRLASTYKKICDETILPFKFRRVQEERRRRLSV